MRADYNPFDKKYTEDTEHGIINYRHDLGTIYITHRHPEHYFKKYDGFGISNSELDICYMKRVYWVIILYHDEVGNIPYRIKLEDMMYLEEYNNHNDKQKIVPIRFMQKKVNGEWKNE